MKVDADALPADGRRVGAARGAHAGPGARAWQRSRPSCETCAGPTLKMMRCATRSAAVARASSALEGAQEGTILHHAVNADEAAADAPRRPRCGALARARRGAGERAGVRAAALAALCTALAGRLLPPRSAIRGQSRQGQGAAKEATRAAEHRSAARPTPRLPSAPRARRSPHAAPRPRPPRKKTSR